VKLPSSRFPERLPAPDRLEQLCVSLATLDAIVSPEWEYRYYSFNRFWDEKTGARMGSMRNGSGDDYFILFSTLGVIIKGFAHDSLMAGASSEVLRDVPATFNAFLSEPAFGMENASFCIWNEGSDGWCKSIFDYVPGNDPDGSEELMGILAGAPHQYVRFAGESYEKDVSLEAVAAIYKHEPLDRRLVASIVTGSELHCPDDVLRELQEIGYPVCG